MTIPINQGNVSPMELLKQWDNSTETNEEVDDYHPLEEEVYQPMTVKAPLSLPRKQVNTAGNETAQVSEPELLLALANFEQEVEETVTKETIEVAHEAELVASKSETVTDQVSTAEVADVTNPSDEIKKDSFPPGSKLFVGNLPLDYDNEQELQDIFSKYGTIHEISFTPSAKMTAGFIQFDTVEAVKESLEKEDRRLMSGGFKLDLLDALEREKMLAAKAERAKSVLQPFPSNTARLEHTEKKRRRSPDRDRRKSPVRSNRERSFSPDTRRRKPYSPIRYTRNSPLAQLFVIDDVNERFVDKVENRCRNLQVTTHISYIPTYHLDRAADDCFHEGVVGVLLLERRGERDNTVTLMMYKNGSIKEYNNMSVEESCRYILREKDAKPPVVANPLSAMMATMGGQLDPNLLLQIASMPGGLGLLQNFMAMQQPNPVAQQLFNQNQGYPVTSQSQIPAYPPAQGYNAVSPPQNVNAQPGFNQFNNEVNPQMASNIQLLLSQLNQK